MAQTHLSWSSQILALPVGSFLSRHSWRILEKYVQSGAASQRVHRLVEFFKTLDWLPLEEISPNPLKHLAALEARAIERDIEAYLEAKQEKRQTQREKREAYKIRVFEYFRSQVSASDKAQLEKLRDYELERLGDDMNWKHYFWFTSFKQIDAFVSQSAQARKALIQQFIQDVETRKKNEDRLREGTYEEYYWGSRHTCNEPDGVEAWFYAQTQQKTSRQTVPRNKTPLEKAYDQLALKPGCTLKEVRSQFRQMALQYHPDTPGGSSEKMKAILAAYDLIKRLHPQP